jgi:hypothetical protein
MYTISFGANITWGRYISGIKAGMVQQNEKSSS